MEVIEAWSHPEPGYLTLHLGDCIELTHGEEQQYSGKNLRSKEVGWFPKNKVKMLPGRPERTVEQAVCIYPGFTEHTYRMVFPFEERFAPLAPHLLTILPSGTVENDKVLEPRKEKGLITFAYPQDISDAAAELPVPQAREGNDDGGSAMNGPGRKVCETPFAWCRENGTNALVQTWPTNLNEKFRKEFEISVGVNPDSTKFLQQAVLEFQEAMVKLFGDAASSCPVWFCRKTLKSASPAVVGFSENVLAHVSKHPELMRELSIARIDLEGLGFVADGTNGKSEKFEKHFRLTPGEECVLYRKTGWDTMGCIKPLHQFLRDAELHEFPTMEKTTPVEEKPELHGCPTKEETIPMDEKPARTSGGELHEACMVEETSEVDEKSAATLVEDPACEPNGGSAPSDSTGAVEPVPGAASMALTAPGSNDGRIDCAVASGADCEGDGNSTSAAKAGPASGWEKFSDPNTLRDWFWNRNTEEWFYAHDSGPWNKFADDRGRNWWWHEPTGVWFFEPGDRS